MYNEGSCGIFICRHNKVLSHSQESQCGEARNGVVVVMGKLGSDPGDCGSSALRHRSPSRPNPSAADGSLSLTSTAVFLYKRIELLKGDLGMFRMS